MLRLEAGDGGVDSVVAGKVGLEGVGFESEGGELGVH